MKLENLLTDIPFLLEAVPLTIPEEGIAYLNDISLWVLTFNSNHPSFDRSHITVKMVIDLLKNHASCYPNQEMFLPQNKNRSWISWKRKIPKQN